MMMLGCSVLFFIPKEEEEEEEKEGRERTTTYNENVNTIPHEGWMDGWVAEKMLTQTYSNLDTNILDFMDRGIRYRSAILSRFFCASGESSLDATELSTL
jgi:hypothetical protein